MLNLRHLLSLVEVLSMLSILYRHYRGHRYCISVIDETSEAKSRLEFDMFLTSGQRMSNTDLKGLSSLFYLLVYCVLKVSCIARPFCSVNLLDT